MSKQNWPAYGDDGVSITATATSAVHLIADNGLERAGEDIMVYNPGPNFVHIKCGSSAVGLAATALSIPVPPQTLSPYRKGVGATHMAVICPSGSQSIVVFTGEGA